MTIRLITGVLTALVLNGGIMASPSTGPIDGFQKVGEAKLEVLFWDIYNSQLYTQSGSFQEDELPVALKIEYLRDIKAEDLIDRTAKEWRKLGYEKADYTPWLESVRTMWPDISEGDELLLVVNETGSSTFYFNGESIGDIPDVQFGPSFLAIWLDEKCSFPKLRKQLIGEVR